MAVKKFRKYSNAGSMISNVNPLLLKDEDSELLRNVSSETLGTWKKRLGTKLFGNQIVSSKNILGTHQFTSSDGASSIQLAVCSDGTNNDIYEIVSTTLNGAITTISTSIILTSGTDFASSGTIEIEGDLITYTGKSTHTLTGVTGISFGHASGVTARQWSKSLEDDTKNLKTRFVDFLDRAIRVNGTDAIKEFDGSSWSTTGDPINPDDAPTGSLIETFIDRIYIAGNSSFPDRIYASSLPDVTGNISWDTSTNIIDKTGSNGFWIDINPEDGQNITAIERNGTNLLIFKERSIYTWNGTSTQPDLLVDIGTISQESVITIHNITFFIGRSKKNIGIYAYTGGYPKLISRKVKKWIDGIDQSNLGNIKAGADEDNIYFYIGTITFTGDDIYEDRISTNTWLVYNIAQDSWKAYDNLLPRAFGYFKSSGQELLIFGDNNGKVFEFGQGETDDSGDSQTPIEMEIISREESFGAPEVPKELMQVDVLTRRGFNTNVNYRYDRREEFKSLGAVDGRFSTLDAPEKYDSDNRGKTLQIQFTDFSNYQSSIDGYTISIDIEEKTRKPIKGKQ